MEKKTVCHGVAMIGVVVFGTYLVQERLNDSSCVLSHIHECCPPSTSSAVFSLDGIQVSPCPWDLNFIIVHHFFHCTVLGWAGTSYESHSRKETIWQV